MFTSVLSRSKTISELIVITLVLLLSACSSKEPSITADQAIVEFDLLYSMPKETISYDEEVRPILESRCVVCHGCYDAPCQLKLSSAEGIERGANKKKVYNGARITAELGTMNVNRRNRTSAPTNDIKTG